MLGVTEKVTHFDKWQTITCTSTTPSSPCILLLDYCVSVSISLSIILPPPSHLLASPDWVRGDVLPHAALSLQQHGELLNPHR